MPDALNGGVRIHYEIEGAGTPLLLHHGTSASGADWRDLGYVDALKYDYKLILIDARGAGASDKPHDATAYDPALRASDVVAVLDDLGVRHGHYFGYSLGGWVGFLLAKYAPDRCTSLILGGAHPYEENMQPVRDRMPKEMDAFMTAMEQVYGSHLTPAMRARLQQSDLPALGAMTQDRSSIADVLPGMKMPCLLFAGDADPRFVKVQQCAAQLSNATFFSLPGRDHVGGLVASALVVPRIKAFLAALG